MPQIDYLKGIYTEVFNVDPACQCVKLTIHYSISETWKSCLKNQTDLKELIPVFFDPSMNPSEWLENRKALRLGRTQKGEAVSRFNDTYP